MKGCKARVFKFAKAIEDGAPRLDKLHEYRLLVFRLAVKQNPNPLCLCAPAVKSISRKGAKGIKRKGFKARVLKYAKAIEDGCRSQNSKKAPPHRLRKTVEISINLNAKLAKSTTPLRKLCFSCSLR